MNKNKPVSYRLPKEITVLIDILSKNLLISKTAIVTLSILDLAKKHNLNKIKDKK